jgi:predicted O-methyltransferase YrrM
MYSRFQLAGKYIWYYLTSSNRKGHGVHSPFVFSFIKNVLRDKKSYPSYKIIETRRKELQEDKTLIEVEDFGAGSGLIKTKQRIVKDIANSSLKPKKYAQVLHRVVHYYQPANILELGTSFGVTTAYLASGNEHARVWTCEGSSSIAAIAQATFDRLQLKSIKLIVGDFKKTLPAVLAEIDKVDFAFVDGNHRKEPTLDYFRNLLEHSVPSTILVFDDIHWSEEMEGAWGEIQQHQAVTLTIDLFFIGLVFLNPEFKVKQHFTIRF